MERRIFFLNNNWSVHPLLFLEDTSQIGVITVVLRAIHPIIDKLTGLDFTGCIVIGALPVIVGHGVYDCYDY